MSSNEVLVRWHFLFHQNETLDCQHPDAPPLTFRSSRPASAPCLEVPSTSYPPSPTSKRARPSPGQRASFRHAAFQAAAEAAARELSGTPPGVLTSWGTAAPVMEAVVPEDAAGTPTTKDGLWRGRPIKQLTIGLKVSPQVWIRRGFAAPSDQSLPHLCACSGRDADVVMGSVVEGGSGLPPG